MLAHNVFDGFEVTVPDGRVIHVVHMACAEPVLRVDGVYLSYMTRQAEQHLMVCPAVNGVGKHADPT